MFDKYLKLELYENQEIDEFGYDYDNSICNICGINADIYYTTYVFDKKIKTKACYLCCSVMNFTNLCMGSMMLIKSKLSQLEINKYTLKYINKHNIVPLPKLIDKSCEIIPLSVFTYAKILQLCTPKEIKLLDYKIFFTGEALKHSKKIVNVYFTENSSDSEEEQQRYDTEYFNIPSYKFTDEESKLIKTKKQEIFKHNSKISTKIRDDINKKISDVKERHSVREMLLKKCNSK